ncbi:hypothetical protein [Streptomyces aureus]|jgi:hypothetical protein
MITDRARVAGYRDTLLAHRKEETRSTLGEWTPTTIATTRGSPA